MVSQWVNNLISCKYTDSSCCVVHPDHFHNSPSLLSNVQTISTAHPASCHGSRPFPQCSKLLILSPDHICSPVLCTNHLYSPSNFLSWVQTIYTAHPASCHGSRPFPQRSKLLILSPDHICSPVSSPVYKPLIQPLKLPILCPDHLYSPPSLLSWVQTISTALQASHPLSRSYLLLTQSLVLCPDHFYSPSNLPFCVQTISAVLQASSPVFIPFLQPFKPPILCPDHFYSPPSPLSCVQTISLAHTASSHVRTGISLEVKYSSL